MVLEHIIVNGVPLTDARWKPYTDSKGTFTWNGVRIKTDGSVRVGETKIHPSRLIQVGDKVQVRGAVVAGPEAIKQASRSVLSENTDKANIQPKKVIATPKNGGVSKVAGVENLGRSTSDRKSSGLCTRTFIQCHRKGHTDRDTAQSTGTKRKSTDIASDSAKKQKTSATSAAETASARADTAATTAASAPKTISGIVLDGQYSDDVPVYESCDQIRTKIHIHLSQPKATKAQFCRDLQAQLFSASAPTKIQSKMLDDFLKKNGPTSGCTSSVYYASYVFFEKWRIVREEAKSKHRLQMEKAWPGGVERERDVSNRGVWCGPNERPRIDSLGVWHFR